MSDLAAVVLAVSAAVGALAARPLPIVVGLACIAVALAVRRPALLWLGVAALASSLAAASWAGLRPPAPAEVVGVATVVSDPEDAMGAVRVEVRLHGKRMDAWAHGALAGRLRRLMAGQRVAVRGRIGPVPPQLRAWLATRHVAARVQVQDVGGVTAGDPLARVTNAVRRTLLRGADALPERQRPLFAGFVLGDDRGQSEETADEFRAAGLTHLLVVSGENVAFVLMLTAPLLGRLGLRGRLVGGLLLLVAFGALTRWEPSVLRAEAMAAIALAASVLGRPVSTLRLLALAVTGLLLVDPLLVHSVGFLLSVGACVGIALLARPIARAIPAPRPLADALGVTAAAQIGVAPVLVPVFGGVPLAALPANLLAVPAAGPVMMWGMTGGLLAGLVDPRLAHWLHLPTRLLVGWIAGVAHWAAGLGV